VLYFDKSDQNHTVSIGIGKLITSITMTIFYIFLWEIGLRYYNFQLNIFINFIVYGLALVRVLICFLPYNKWLEEKGSFVWGIIRNIPFVALGMIVMVMFFVGTLKFGGNLSFVWLAVLISFLFYVPVVILSNQYPKIGMFMLPKSCAYVAIVLMGFFI
jgi:hypothetical protein